MKVTVDRARCQGHAMCSFQAPEVYELDDNGYNSMGTFVVPAGLEDTARRGALACPEQAIQIVEAD
jgi:ferredoxin